MCVFPQNGPWVSFCFPSKKPPKKGGVPSMAGDVSNQKNTPAPGPMPDCHRPRELVSRGLMPSCTGSFRRARRFGSKQGLVRASNTLKTAHCPKGMSTRTCANGAIDPIPAQKQQNSLLRSKQQIEIQRINNLATTTSRQCDETHLRK